mmetsp:Transcript_5217/g.7704  ORF Transcript_5217/g.7704 Transcript_5217/m.7704 type:complete len:159 (+) Transcript_5217:498-974(+)
MNNNYREDSINKAQNAIQQMALNDIDVHLKGFLSIEPNHIIEFCKHVTKSFELKDLFSVLELILTKGASQDWQNTLSNMTNNPEQFKNDLSNAVNIFISSTATEPWKNELNTQMRNFMQSDILYPHMSPEYMEKKGNVPLHIFMIEDSIYTLLHITFS